MKNQIRELVNIVNFGRAAAICHVKNGDFASQMPLGEYKLTKFTSSHAHFELENEPSNRFHTVFTTQNTVGAAGLSELLVLLLTIMRDSRIFVMRVVMEGVNFVNYGFLKFTRKITRGGLVYVRWGQARNIWSPVRMRDAREHPLPPATYRRYGGGHGRE